MKNIPRFSEDNMLLWMRYGSTTIYQQQKNSQKMEIPARLAFNLSGLCLQSQSMDFGDTFLLGF